MVKEPYECFDLIGALQFPDPQVVVAIPFPLLEGHVGNEDIRRFAAEEAITCASPYHFIFLYGIEWNKGG